MESKIFYSWQSDVKGNRRFILECIEKAVKELNKNDDLEIYEIERDTSGDSGSPDIKERVFSKIEKSDYFIADISIINKDLMDRKTPNPNVLIELGYAASRLGWDRIICLFNKESGELSDLPFDLRTHRITPFSLVEGKSKVQSSIVKAIINTVEIVKSNINYDSKSYYKIFPIDNIIEAIEDSIHNILERKVIQNKFGFSSGDYMIDFWEYEDEMDDDKFHFGIDVTFIDDHYSYGELNNRECSIILEFNEVLKQINFGDNRLYVAMDVSPGYSPSGKGRNYGKLESVVLELL